MNLAAVDLNLLVAFDALLGEGSVSAAAARIGLSQPAMSKRLAHLRHLFADDLFVRSADGMRPTEKALDLADPIRAALRQIEDALGGLGQFSPARSQRVFRIATTDHVAASLVPELMATLRRNAPRTSIIVRSLHRQEVVDQLEKGSVDLAITILPDAPTSIKRLNLFHVDWVSVVSASHPEIRDELTLDLYLKYPHIVVTHVGDLKGYVDRMLDDRNLKRTVMMSLPYALAVPPIVASTDMICTLSANLIGLADWPGVRSFPVPFEYSGYEETMLWHRRNDSDPGHLWLRRTVLQVSEKAGATTIDRRAGAA
ncbi:LysR family transcriptional regulator [Rhizobium azibense]|uniref:LysR family transcriptional regulator n=2 Tax=Rhizobium azibense TaxID=1136135 RepID=A0A4R3RJ17_9HYPH|nr:LysR family transcriptional regulator [Rhizobium azibense]TCU14973.1 LysR family transcriptional regulator [Rhizobium azibense]TCU31356.1 LysR family transcriptional regulator [Rhizobium azibense]